ncbi:MAG TPA: rhomboid family intramembrane serine protease [Candidatus Aenigmarchaeota archaeon]|nr:rhomboid family intramembrane serine protease [Candidatus Aenigmarchaeota archaeon]
MEIHHENLKPCYLTSLLITVNVAIFILVFSLPQQVMEWVFRTFSFSSTTSLEIWRWFTSLFLHVSASHLFFNMLGLYFFGSILEREVSAQWYLSIYFISGLIGTFVYMFTSADPVVGASGCIFGLMGAAMLMNPIKRIHFYVFPLPLGIVAISFVVFEALIVYFRPEHLQDIANNVAHVAHLGGVLAGAVFAFFYDTMRALKGVGMLLICVILMILLAPVLTLIALVGGFVLNVIEYIVGFFLYGLANLISPLWV